MFGGRYVEHNKFIHFLLIKNLDGIERIAYINRVRKLPGLDKNLFFPKEQYGNYAGKKLPGIDVQVTEVVTCQSYSFPSSLYSVRM